MPDQTNPDAKQPLPKLSDTVVVRWLIGLNLILHALNAIFQVDDPRFAGTQRTIGQLTLWGNFNVAEGINGLQVWRLFSYQFLHGGYIHLGMNMMALYFFGPLIEKWWGPRRFLAFYLLCGACGAWLMALFAFFPSLLSANEAWLVGASGSIFGVLVATAMLYPKDEVKLIFPPIWVTTRKLSIVFIGLSIVSMLFDFNFGGNAAHLGGALFGYLLVRRPWSLDFIDPRAPRLEPPSKAGTDA